MILNKLCIKGFRCYQDTSNIPIHKLSVFVGQNDAGKTYLLRAVEILLTNQRPTESDYRKCEDGTKEEEIVISGEFTLEDHDTIPEDYRNINGSDFRLSKTFTSTSLKCEVDGRGYSDPRFNSFVSQKATVQKELLESLSIEPAGNAQARADQLERAEVDGSLVKVGQVREVQFSVLSDHLPIFQLISSTSYKHPDSFVQQTLRVAVNSYINPMDESTGQPRLLRELRPVKTGIENALNIEVRKIRGLLKASDKDLVDIRVAPTIDFSRSLAAINLMADVGEGFQYIDDFGEGRKKKLWMGLLEWDRVIQEQSTNRSILRAYDEPDVNLDYEAERKLFSSILSLTKRVTSKVQALICTHAVTMVDQAPAESINLIEVDDDGQRVINYLKNAGNDDLKDFLAVIGRNSGISNSALFYEKAFLLVEGESEENAIPILYQQLYGRSLIEDRITVINLMTCGAWKSVLGVLSHNRAELTVMLLDQDCNEAGSSGKVTEETLLQIGYPATFRNDNCFYIGTKEFEDAFRTEDIVAVLDQHWPKKDEEDWDQSEIDRLRQEGKKFSADLMKYMRQNCKESLRNTARKAEFAERLARHCTDEGQIPHEIIRTFERIRLIAGHGVIDEAPWDEMESELEMSEEPYNV